MEIKNLKLKIKNLFCYLVIWLLGYWVIPFSALAENGENIIGEINPPGWLEKHGSVEVEGEGGFGLINFFSNILRLLTIVAGLFAVLNLILAGWGFITSQGDPEKLKSAQSKITNSLIGLIIIAVSFTIAAILGWILFGDATMIIAPKIWGPGE